LYLLGGTQHGALFEAVLSRRKRPADGWGSWPLVLDSWFMCLGADHTFTPITHTLSSKSENDRNKKRQEDDDEEEEEKKKRRVGELADEHQ
jgi:hypothetical protein